MAAHQQSDYPNTFDFKYNGITFTYTWNNNILTIRNDYYHGILDEIECTKEEFWKMDFPNKNLKKILYVFQLNQILSE